MGSDEYTKALSVAEKELARLNAEAEAIAQRRAQLQQTISTLKTLTNGSEQEERTLTDAIRIIVKAADGYISAANVLKSAYAMGAKFSGKNPKASIITILGRLVKDGELERERGTIKVRFRSKTRAAL
jgi:regulator of protease activity HflC (stomatin/prohibitin superfamily)